ncbi:PREDICTED: uncharacterized protein LOC105452223 [Wasmannia auropunctata]|uniref:uncharacterized protein LOC105452223 n=1 Tax=Wasmannia auropunctata TaxID=64793 RepID=UPI0005EF4349|nr:PREDICTED: uncharacterized protein LOC105452223 [Wasmannia auropunctata]
MKIALSSFMGGVYRLFNRALAAKNYCRWLSGTPSPLTNLWMNCSKTQRSYKIFSCCYTGHRFSERTYLVPTAGKHVHPLRPASWRSFCILPPAARVKPWASRISREISTMDKLKNGYLQNIEAIR